MPSGCLLSRATYRPSVMLVIHLLVRISLSNTLGALQGLSTRMQWHHTAAAMPVLTSLSWFTSTQGRLQGTYLFMVALQGSWCLSPSSCHGVFSVTDQPANDAGKQAGYEFASATSPGASNLSGIPRRGLCCKISCCPCCPCICSSSQPVNQTQLILGLSSTSLLLTHLCSMHLQSSESDRSK